jgi:uncharacterized lipoprotein YmbA
MSMRPTLLLTLAALALSACGRPDYFLTPPPMTPDRPPVRVSSLAVADLGLPTYAESVEIAVQSPTGEVTLDEDALGPTPPAALSPATSSPPSRPAFPARSPPSPGPPSTPPALRLEVAVDRMIGTPGGPFTFSGQYVIVSPESGRITASDRFAITLPAGAGSQGLVNAHARAVERLADQIAGRLARGGGAS